MDLQHHLRKDLTGGNRDLEFASSSRATFLCLGENINASMIRNVSLTLDNIAESIARTLTAQQKSLDSLAKDVLHNRGALDYLLAEQRGVCAVAPAAPGLTLLEKLKLRYIRSLANHLA